MYYRIDPTTDETVSGDFEIENKIEEWCSAFGVPCHAYMASSWGPGEWDSIKPRRDPDVLDLIACSGEFRDTFNKIEIRSMHKDKTLRGFIESHLSIHKILGEA